MIDKKLVKQRFGKHLSAYNQNAKVQKQMAEKLLSYLDFERKYDSILEIGCGTGFLTKLAAEKLFYQDYNCIDIVPDCEDYIKKINSKIEFTPCDMEEFLNNTEKKYDLIISNASFQWIENFESFGKLLISKLNNGGVLLFSTFGQENYREIFFTIGKTLKYKNRNEIKEIFKEYKTSIEEEIRILSFNTPKDILKHLKSTGVNGIESTRWTKKDLADFENGYNNICSGNPTLTYNPIYVMVK